MRVNEEKLSNRRKQRKNQKRRKIVFTVLLAIVAVFIAGAAYAWSRISKAEDAIHQKVETVQLRDKELTDDSSFSVLLLGIDNGAYGRETEVGRSDTMLLVTVNPKQKKTTMISIPRDSYTEIIGYGTFDKINHAYAFGKEKFSINSVQNMLNIPIDYYITVDMNGLIGLVNAVGGIEVTPNLTFTYENESFTEGITRHVDGEAALRYARMRYDDTEGDTGRQKRQQYVIQKLVEKLLSLGSVTKYEEILKALENSVRTNFTVEKLFQIAQTHKEALQHFESDTINGDGAMIGGVYYFVIPEAEKIRVSNVIRKSLDLEEISELKHIETKESQSSVNIEQHVPQNNPGVEEQGDTYVEPNVIPNNNYNYNNNNTNNNNNNNDDGYVAPTNPANNAVDTSASTQAAPVTQAPQVTAAPEQPQPVQPTQSAPATQEPVKPVQPTQKQNP
mgnify:FL=1